jgi:hypothetical protein
LDRSGNRRRRFDRRRRGSDAPEGSHRVADGADRDAAEALFAMLSDVDKYGSWRTDVKSLQRLPDKDGKPAWVETSAA